MIEVKKIGYCSIYSEIIDLDDNSIVYKTTSLGMGKIKGNWNAPPDYESLKTAIKTAIDNSIELEKTKFK